MVKYKAKMGRPRKYDFESWKIGERVIYPTNDAFRKARFSAYYFGDRNGMKFSSSENREGGGYIVRIK